MTEDADLRLALIYAESVRALDAQATHLADLRGRGMSMLGIVAGASGLIGAVSTKRHGFDWWAAAAGVGFVVAMVSAIWATLPGRFRFVHDPTALIDAYVDGEYPRSLDETHRWLARRNGEYWLVNEELIRTGLLGGRRKVPGSKYRRGIGPLFCLRVAALSLAVEVVAWVIHVQR